MSRILRRPLFRGGPVSSYGTGIASGLADNRRVGLDNGGFLYSPATGRTPTGAELMRNADTGIKGWLNRNILGPKNQFKINNSFNDYSIALANNSYDAVAITTPPHLHLPIAKLASNKGSHLFIEKPLGMDCCRGWGAGGGCCRIQAGRRPVRLQFPAPGVSPGCR